MKACPRLRILVVDDDPSRIDRLRAWLPDDARIVWACDAGKALGILEHEEPDGFAGVMLDFDLSQRLYVSESTSMTVVPVVRRIIERVSRDTPILVHSTHPRGGPQIAAVLDTFRFPVSQVPMSRLDASGFLTWLEDCRELHEERRLN